MKLSEIQKDKSKLYEMQVLSYLPIAHKTLMINGGEEVDGIKEVTGIIDDCIKEKNGMYYIDHFAKEVSFVLCVVMNYTDLEFDEIELKEGYTIYDFIMESRIWECVQKHIPEEEMRKIHNLLDESLYQELEIKNSLQGILSRNLIKFVDVVDKNMNPKEMKSLLKAVSKEVKGLDQDKIKELSKLMGVTN
ncbi:MAG: hypothetical protein PHN69_05160 [Candidatus Pacebacteria bacterium]|nr:hypothetical protein [Candidatus Paceibacterota bacterium]